jgi:hypothetical protein
MGKPLDSKRSPVTRWMHPRNFLSSGEVGKLWKCFDASATADHPFWYRCGRVPSHFTKLTGPLPQQWFCPLRLQSAMNRFCPGGLALLTQKREHWATNSSVTSARVPNDLWRVPTSTSLLRQVLLPIYVCR